MQAAMQESLVDLMLAWAKRLVAYATPVMDRLKRLMEPSMFIVALLPTSPITEFASELLVHFEETDQGRSDTISEIGHVSTGFGQFLRGALPLVTSFLQIQSPKESLLLCLQLLNQLRQ